MLHQSEDVKLRKTLVLGSVSRCKTMENPCVKSVLRCETTENPGARSVPWDKTVENPTTKYLS